MNGSLKLVLLLLLVESGHSHAQNLSACFANLSPNDMIYSNSDEIYLPGDGRPWVIIIFKACCSTNRRALRWVLDTKKTFGDSVGVLGLNSDYARALSKVKPWLAVNKVDFTVFQDPSHEVINALSIIAVPTIIILTASGEEDFRSAGFFGGSGNVMEEHLRKLLSKSYPISGDRNGK